jgi:hypothetical protein
MNCPTLGAEVPEPCPRAPCDACRESLDERSAIIEHCSGRPVTRSEADALARQQAVETMLGQRRLVK